MIPQELIEKALNITGKTMEDMEIIQLEGEYVDYQIEDGYDERYIQTPVYVFSIEKFCYYLLSIEFIDKYAIFHLEMGVSGFSDHEASLFRLSKGMQEYQNGNEEPLISLLEKI